MSAFITKEAIEVLRSSGQLVIRPLLEPTQITSVGIDLRLGCNFLVSVHGREPFINTSRNVEFASGQSNIKRFFQESRRQLGETFILYPNQTVLASSLEYLKIPNTLMLALYMRNSYSRLGLTLSTVVQPGYCGCLSIELTNNNINPVNLTVGARIFQGIFLTADQATDYHATERKYVCSVRPEPSAAIADRDLEKLTLLWEQRNDRSEKSG